MSRFLSLSDCYIKMCSVRLLESDYFIERKIERKAESMHVRAGTNKDGVCLERNTTGWVAPEAHGCIDVAQTRRRRALRTQELALESRDKWTFYLEDKDAIERLEMKEHQKEIALWNV